MAIDVEKLGPEHRIEMYIKTDCPYCAEAQAFYRSKGVPFTAIEAQHDAVQKRRMLDLAGGDPTVPAIVVDGKYVQSGWGKPPQG